MKVESSTSIKSENVLGNCLRGKFVELFYIKIFLIKNKNCTKSSKTFKKLNIKAFHIIIYIIICKMQ